ncbi:MAG: DUF4333 domain-containing protein [Allobranchiibius sp.]|nr:DUF4333 domain-containing protein [Actinomycetota bacterium]
MTTKRWPLMIATSALLAVGISGCGGTSDISGTDLAAKVSTALTKQVGHKPDKITCPKLKSKVGATADCTLTDGGVRLKTVVTVTSVKGTDVQFGILVAKKPE